MPIQDRHMPLATASKARRHRGFTLMEMLIAIAIIAVLIAIAIPLFTSQVDNAKKATDESNARSAYAAAMAQHMLDTSAGAQTYYFDAAAGTVVAGSSAGIEPYGQWDDEADYEVSGIAVTGNAARNGVVAVAFDDNFTPSVSWGKATLSLWSKLNTTVGGTAWYSDSTDRRASFEALVATDNATRKAADVEILDDLAAYFNGMDATEAQRILGDTRYNRIVNAHGDDNLFEYGQDGGGSIRINGLDTTYQPYFSALGYRPQIYTTQGTWRETDAYAAGTNGYNYTDKYLFTSNEMLGSTYKSGVTHGVRIKFDVENGKVTNAKVWVNGLADQGYTSE